MRIGGGNDDIGKFAGDQLLVRFVRRFDIDDTVDFRRIGIGTPDAAVMIDLIEQYAQRLADLGLQAFSGNLFLQQHDPATTLFTQGFRHRVRQGIGGGAIDRRIGKATQSIDLRFFQEIQ